MFGKKLLPKSRRRSLLFEQLEKRKQELPRTVLKPKSKLVTAVHYSRFWRKIQKFILCIIILLIAASGIYVVFFSKSFKVQEITYTDLTGRSSTPIFSSLFEPLKNRHFFFVATASLERQIREKYPYEIQKAAVFRKFPGKLVVKYQPFPDAFNLIARTKNAEKRFVVNTKGFAVSIDEQNPDIPNVRHKEEVQEFPKAKTVVLSEEITEKIVRAYTLFTDKFGIKVPLIIYEKNAREIHLKTEKGFMIWIDLTQNVERQLFKLKRALQKLDIYKEPLEYIDLRVSGKTGDRIIFKRK